MYFKVIQDNNITDIGCTFLKYNENKKRMYVCDAEEGQFLQSLDESKVYRDDWMKPAPDVMCIHAQVVGIDETEFMDIQALLDEGEEVIVAEPLIEQSSEQEEPEQQKPMSIAEMRSLIIEQQKKIDELMKKLQ